MLKTVLRLSLTLALAGGASAQAVQADPAAGRVEAFCNGVIDTVKGLKGAGARARADQLRPLIEGHFELPIVAQFAVGQSWTSMTPADRTSVVAGLSRYTAARYAQEFETYSGQRCTVDPAVVTRGADKLVKTQVTEGGETTSVDYRLREYGGAWKVVDVYFRGVSQLATQRADFAGVLRTSGAPGLVAKLNELTARMLAERR
jgi:phospholipid transport system substrate-binding protein